MIVINDAMKKNSLFPLGETELEVLQHVWSLGRARVSDVRDEILKNRRVAYTTVMTVMRNLAEKGYLDFESDGSSYFYTAIRSERQVKESILDELVGKIFDGSPEALVQTLVNRESMSDETRAEILDAINKLEDK
jgi:predicted transcriptional regulator